MAHVVPASEERAVPERVRAYCGREFASEELEFLDDVRGMPCESCLRHVPGSHGERPEAWLTAARSDEATPVRPLGERGRNVVLSGAQYELIESALAADTVDLGKVSTYLFAVYCPASRAPVLPMPDEQRGWVAEIRVRGVNAVALTHLQWAEVAVGLDEDGALRARAREVLRTVADPHWLLEGEIAR